MEPKSDSRRVRPGALADRSKRARDQAERTRVQARVIRARSEAVRKQFRSKPALPPPRLSPRELEVLALLASGVTTKDLALQLGISINTANYHLANVYRKLGVHSRVAATNAYFRRLAQVD